MIKNSVVFLCQYFYPEKVSSATLPFELAKYFKENAYEVACLCGMPHDFVFNSSDCILSEEKLNGINIHRLKYKNYNRKNFFGRLFNYFSFTFKALLNVKKIKDYEYVIVYSNPPILPYVAYRAHKKFGTKIIFVSYDVYPEIAVSTKMISNDGTIAKIMNFVNKKLYDNVYKVVALSNDMKTYLINNRNISEEKVVVVSNWYNQVQYVEPKQKDFYTVSYFGNLGICQDVQTILDTAKILREDKTVRFVLGGQGQKVDYIRNFINENKLFNVVLMDFLTGDEYEQKMRESDCFIVSLVEKMKGLCSPSKYYSCLAYGRPIIAIMEENNLTEEIKQASIGFAVLNGDSKGLIESIEKAKKDNQNLMGKKAFDLYNKNYTINICGEKYIALLKGKE